MSLAIKTYEGIRTLRDDPGLLNLAWTLDERAQLSLDLDELLSTSLRAEIEGDLAHINRYLVKDPYGEEALRPAVAAHFALSETSFEVSCGAGVASLLAALANLPQARTVRVLGDVYPDFPFWIQRSGGSCPAPSAEARAGRPSIVFLERPSLTGDGHAALSDVVELCREAASIGAIVIIDESNANYYPPAFSAVSLVPTHENLLVLRGVSKAYQLGGLRLGYAVGSAQVTRDVRSVLPPLLTASLSLRLADLVLRSGDVAAPLRQKIAANKAIAIRLLHDAGVSAAEPASQYLPYVFVRGEARSESAFLESRGVRGKLHPVWSASAGGVHHLYRLSAPLDDRRMELLREKLSSPGGGGASEGSC